MALLDEIKADQFAALKLFPFRSGPQEADSPRSAESQYGPIGHALAKVPDVSKQERGTGAKFDPPKVRCAS